MFILFTLTLTLLVCFKKNIKLFKSEVDYYINAITNNGFARIFFFFKWAFPI